MVDVDNFKAYNDANGHLGGDECLKRIATAVASEMRANDLVARYGGEEFAVILPNQSLKGAASVAERIRAGSSSCRCRTGWRRCARSRSRSAPPPRSPPRQPPPATWSRPPTPPSTAPSTWAATASACRWPTGLSRAHMHI
jgi:hypothetical protein